MPTVRQYYDSDFKDFIGPEGPIPLRKPDGAALTAPVMWKMLLGYDSRAAFFVCYIPAMLDSQAAALAVIENFDWLMNIKNTISLSEGFPNEPMNRLDECVFTGRLILYVEAELPETIKLTLVERGGIRNLAVLVRDVEYMKQKDQRSRPVAFIWFFRFKVQAPANSRFSTPSSCSILKMHGCPAERAAATDA